MKNMKNDEKPFPIKGKSATVGIVVCFIAVIIMVGTYTFSNYQKKLDQQLAQAEELAKTIAEEENQETTTDNIVLPEQETTDTGENTQESGDNAEGTTTADHTDEAEAANNAAAALSFSEDSVLEWPASGVTLMDYSMDHTVYFSTLAQYKYNPALIVSGQVGEEISASAAGIVTNIEQNAQTGVTVTLDMGNGYTAVYGQLKEVPVALGDYLDKGNLIGYLSEPTKYYSMEGPNLYFEVMKDGEPVNPVDYME